MNAVANTGANTGANAVTKTERGFTLVRHLNAPRDRVFAAWTDPDQLDQWYAGPGPTQNIPTTVDLRVGGAWRLHMVENESRAYMTGGIYREIVPPERLVFSWGAIDGWPKIEPDRLDDVPIFTLTFNELDGGTEMISEVRLADHVSKAAVQEWLATGMAEGWTHTIDRIIPYLDINAG